MSRPAIVLLTAAAEISARAMFVYRVEDNKLSADLELTAQLWVVYVG
jgi:hypothetical protein